MGRKSYSGYLVFMAGNLISWGCSKQHTVALSSTEAEYMALSDMTREVMHLIHMIGEFATVPRPITVFCDNKGAIFLGDKAINNKRSKHIDIRFHFVRDHIQKGDIVTEYVGTKDNYSDVLTKPVTRETTEQFVQCVMHVDIQVPDPKSG